MKHGLFEPDLVVHIGRLAELSGVRESDDHIEIGALTTLQALIGHPLVRAHCPGLVKAASQVAGPQLRRMGTLGGNLALDTRCLYYNQSYFWREAVGFCLKKDGTVCHVVAGGQKCVAAASNDTATLLLCLDTTVTLRSTRGERSVALADFFVPDGVRNTILAADEILTRVRVRKAHGQRQGFAKLRHRNSIDFPLLSVGVAVELSDGRATSVRGVVSALQARPLRLQLGALVGRAPDAAWVAEAAATAQQRAHPMTNIADDPAWRKAMVPVMVKRAFADAGLRGAP
jgi:4-hydroxybenzoyl-CoA reductase subunit beta